MNGDREAWNLQHILELLRLPMYAEGREILVSLEHEYFIRCLGTRHNAVCQSRGFVLFDPVTEFADGDFSTTNRLESTKNEAKEREWETCAQGSLTQERQPTSLSCPGLPCK
jgi:hypothetical protein